MDVPQRATTTDLPAEPVLFVTGDLDAAAAPALRCRLHHASADPGRELTVDLSGVTFVDCEGFRPLLDAQRHLADRLHLRAASPSVLRLLRLTGQMNRFHHVEVDHRAFSVARPGVDEQSALEAGSPASRDRLADVDGGSNLKAVGEVSVAYLQSWAPLDLWVLTAPDAGGQVVLASAGPWAADLQVGTVLPWLGSFALHMAAGTAPSLAPRTADVPQYAAAAVGRWSSVRAYTGVAVVLDDGDVVATLSGLSSDPDHPSIARTCALLDLIRASLRATADVERAHRQALDSLARAHHLAETDALTGLRNLRGWHAALAQETARCARHDTSACIVSVDLDELKAVNDQYGHNAGDRLLHVTAQVLTRACRPSDVVARPGGDEFAVLAIEADRAAGDRLTRRIADEFAAAGIQASTGGATSTVGEDLRDTWVRADSEMYVEKRARAARPFRSSISRPR